MYNNIAALRIRLKEAKIYSLSFKKFFCIKNRTDDPWYIEELEATFPFCDLETCKKIFEILNITIPDIQNTLSKLKSLKDLLNLFSRYGFSRQIHINKKRQTFLKEDTEISIDDVEKLGTIVEIESKKSNPKHIVDLILQPTEWERSIEGISNIFMRINYGQDQHLHYMKNFESDPSWNVWETEKTWYQNLN